jgi:hypothetical protein
MVAIVLLLQKIAVLSSTPELRDPVAKLSIERRTVYLSSELFDSHLDQLWPTLNPDLSSLFDAIRVIVCQYLHLVKHRTAELIVDLRNNDWPNVVNRRCGALPCVDLQLTPMLKTRTTTKTTIRPRNPPIYQSVLRSWRLFGSIFAAASLSGME